MDGVVEIITGRERRRRWSVEEKLRIVAETQAVGAQVSAVAARNGLCDETVENLGVIMPHSETDDAPNAPRQRDRC
jgi:hypothetical protein